MDGWTGLLVCVNKSSGRIYAHRTHDRAIGGPTIFSAALLGDRQNGISTPEWVLDAFLGVWVGQPLAVHDKKIFMAARPHFEITLPSAIAGGRERSLLRLPIIERAGYEHLSRSRVY